jgi:AcrR family transcriptional regulator
MKQKLVKTAFDLFASKGFKNVSIDMIAAKASVTKGALYWHFKSKKELILATCDYYYEKWKKEADTAIAKESTARQQLEGVIRMATHRCLFDKKNRLFTFELSVLSMSDEAVRKSWAAFADSVREVYLGLVVKTAQEEGIVVVDPEENVDWYASMMEGLKHRAVFEPCICNPSNFEDSVQKFLRVVLRGIPSTEIATIGPGL